MSRPVEPGRLYAVRITVEISPCGDDGPSGYETHLRGTEFWSGEPGDDFERLARQAARRFADYMAGDDRKAHVAAKPEVEAAIARYKASLEAGEVKP